MAKNLNIIMELIVQGNSHFVQDNWQEASHAYQSAIQADSSLEKAHEGLAYSLFKLGRLQASIDVSRSALQVFESSSRLHYLLGRALFYKQNFIEAEHHLSSSQESSARPLLEKCRIEVSRAAPIMEPYTWYQSQQEVFIVANFTPKTPESVLIEIKEKSLHVSGPTMKGTDYNLLLSLSEEVIPDQSHFKTEAHKITITLKKRNDRNWTSLEDAKPLEQAPSYPSSSKKAKDWSKLDREFELELKKEKPEGEQALQELFKEIYANGDEETRRAMIKSFQTSGGTVLSTNWGEVSEKDYEGKDRPDAPAGQQWVDPKTN